jgi:predicted transcriptional regulator
MELTANGPGSSKVIHTIAELPNVVRDIRSVANMTQKELADLADVSPLFILRAEQYLHVALSERLAHVLSEIDTQGRSAATILETYITGRGMQLRINGSMLTQNPYYKQRVKAALDYATDHFLNSDQAVTDSGKHPFTLFRTYLFTAFDLPTSQIKFANFTGIHPTVIANLEAYKGSMEHSIKRALSVVLDLSNEEIATLQIMCERAL